MRRRKLFETLRARMSERVAMVEAAAKDSPGMVGMLETHLEEDVSVAAMLFRAFLITHKQYCEPCDIQMRHIRQERLESEMRSAWNPRCGG